MDKNGYQAHPWYDAQWDLRHIRDGKVIWAEKKRNALLNEGEENILYTYFLNATTGVSPQPTEFWVRLCNDSLAEDDKLVDVIGEPTGNGYEPFKLERSAVGWPSVEPDAGDYRVVSKTITFTAIGGAIGPISTVFLATTDDNSGKLIAANGLSIVRTILNGDTLEGTIRIKLQ